MEKEIRQFRFVQESISTYTLWLDADSSRVDEDRILNFIQPYFGEEAKITIEYKKDIPLLRSGKRKLFENRCERYGK
jgi:phenylacetate-CoA ligase